MSSEAPIHETRMGRRFFEHTMPGLVDQLEQANENLERIASGLDDLITERPASLSDRLDSAIPTEKSQDHDDQDR